MTPDYRAVLMECREQLIIAEINAKDALEQFSIKSSKDAFVGYHKRVVNNIGYALTRIDQILGEENGKL